MLMINNLVGFGAFVGGFGPATTAFSATLTANQTGFEGYSLRSVYTLSVAGDQVRIKFEAPSASPVSVDNASVGIHSSVGNMSTVPVELLFSGASGYNLLAGQTIFSDWTTLVQSAVAIVVVQDISVTNGTTRVLDAVGQGLTRGAAATNSYNVQSPSLAAVGSNYNVSVPLIEVRSAL